MVVHAMKQETFTDIEYSFRKKKTKREEFLEIMDEIIPWDEWVGVIEPYKKTVYRGLVKNENRLYAMFACANLYALAIAGRRVSTT